MKLAFEISSMDAVVIGTPVSTPTSEDMITRMHSWEQNYYGSTQTPVFSAMKLSSRAKIPKKANSSDAGFDLYALNNGCIAPKMRLAIETGLAVAIPRGWYGRVAPRSGLAHNFGIDVLAGVIDSSYRGEIKVILINHGTGDFSFEAGDRIAQLVLEKCGEWQIQEVESLDQTVRGEGGFGSTGK